MKFAKRVFLIAGIYGVIVMAPMYFLEPMMKAQGQTMTRPEMLYGFVGVTLAYQAVFFLISSDPARYRPLMLVSLWEKVSFGAAVWPLYLMGRTPGIVTVFATIDLFWMVMFAISWLRTKPAAA